MTRHDAVLHSGAGSFARIRACRWKAPKAKAEKAETLALPLGERVMEVAGREMQFKSFAGTAVELLDTMAPKNSASNRGQSRSSPKAKPRPTVRSTC